MGRKPDFVIVGAMRSGTSSLAGYLDEHPEVFVTPRKEVHYFNRFYERGFDWYLEQFVDSGEAVAVGEATPNYMYVPQASERMVTDLPQAKLVAILREPVSRAYSHYWFNRARGHEPLSFAKALAAEPARLAEADLAGRERASYFDRGLYVDQLENLAGHFPREQIHVVLFEDLIARPVETVSDVCRFLGVDTNFQPPNLGRQINAYKEARWPKANRYFKPIPKPLGKWLYLANRKKAAPYPQIPEELATELAKRYEPSNERLGAWLGRDLDTWRRT